MLSSCSSMFALLLLTDAPKSTATSLNKSERLSGVSGFKEPCSTRPGKSASRLIIDLFSSNSPFTEPFICLVEESSKF